ncbi:hypothetical protein Tsubulata_031378, partial [Turnera subulata]
FLLAFICSIPLALALHPKPITLITMRMSCNGCRVLRKGCSDDCIIRPCLDWITSPDSQANATLFLAKFYGRAGLMNLIEAGPQDLRPSIFRSLLYEACGRIVNPVNGSVGLLWTGDWAQCQSAVDAVLSGSPIMEAPPPPPSDGSLPNLDLLTPKRYDIRHVARDPNAAPPPVPVPVPVPAPAPPPPPEVNNRVNRTRTRARRSRASWPNPQQEMDLAQQLEESSWADQLQNENQTMFSSGGNGGDGYGVGVNVNLTLG